MFFTGMVGLVFGVWSDHGEGLLHFPDASVVEEVRSQQLAPLSFVGPEGEATEVYPYNPNGSPEGWTALCSPDGRHLGLMPHPERCFLDWQCPWMPESMRSGSTASPWLELFHNARKWCIEHS